MAQYRKKPVVVEAVQIQTVEINDKLDVEPGMFIEFPDWLKNAQNVYVFQKRGSDWAHVAIKTLEGTMEAEPGDWIIRGVQGELYPCKPDIFAATYEPASLAHPTLTRTPQ